MEANNRNHGTRSFTLFEGAHLLSGPVALADKETVAVLGVAQSAGAVLKVIAIIGRAVSLNGAILGRDHVVGILCTASVSKCINCQKAPGGLQRTVQSPVSTGVGIMELKLLNRAILQSLVSICPTWSP